MKKLTSLMAIAFISTTAFAANHSLSPSADISAMGAAWKHQNPVSVGNNNLTMVGGQDISNRSVFEGPITAA